MKKTLLLILAILAFVFCFTACGEDGPTEKTITVVAGSIATEYEVGDTPDFSGIKAVVTYSDGTAKTVTYAELTLGTVDTSTAGEKKLTVKYGEASCEVTITVKEKEAPVTLSSIKIVAGTVATEVYIGSALDVSALQVEATYSDGSVKVIDAKDLEITNIDASTVGDKTLTVKYEDKTDTLTVKVSGITSITLAAGTVKDKVFVGATLDTSLIEVLVTYDNGKTEIVKASALTIGTIDTAEAGDKTLEISYKGAKIEHTVTVVGDKMLTITGNVEDYVKVGGTLDTSGITASLEYTDGTFKALTNAEIAIQNIDTATAGEKTLKITYNGLEATKTVTVVGIKSLTVTGVAAEVLVGATLDLDSISVYAEYTNSAIVSETLTKSDLTLGSVDTATAGAKKLSVTYLDKTVEVDVKVCGVESIRVDGIKKVLAAGEELDISEMKVYAVYGDTAKTEVLITADYTTNYDDIDFNSVDDKDFIVTYSGVYGSFTATVKITATAPALESIVIRTAKGYVILGGTYDKSSITVTAYYANDTEDVIANSALVIGDIVTSEAGTKKLSVSYTEGGVTKDIEVDVEVLPVTALQISGIANKVDKGATLDTSAASALVTFSNGTYTETVNVTVAGGLTIAAADTTTGGDKTLAVSYLGFETTFAYHVKAATSIAIYSGLANVLMPGASVDTSMLVIEITYTDGTKEHKKPAEVGADVNVSGATVTVTYDGLTAQKTIDVVEIVSVNALNGTVPGTVLVGAVINYNEFKLTVICKDGSVYLIGKDDPNLTITTIDTSTPGTKAVIFTYLDFSAIVNIVVNGVKELELVEGTILTTVNVGQAVETAGIKIKVIYTDDTYAYVDTTYLDLVVGSVDTSAAGNKILTVTYMGVTLEIAVSVVDVDVSGIIFAALLPDSIVARETYKKNFKDQTQAYVVGDDNPYYFYLNVLMLDANDDIVDVDGKTIASVVKVYDVTDGGETLLEGAALTAMVAVDPAKNSYDFTDAAIGRSFKLVIRPADNYVDEEAVTQSHTVTVVDGYNIYEAWELNLMTNYDDDMDDGDIEGHNGQLAAVDKFLATKGVTRPAVINGIILHCNLDVQEKDIPADYIYTYVKDGVTKRGFYDHLSLFNRAFDAANPNFTIYGNYYSVYTYNLPCVVEKGVANNDDEYSSSEVFRFHPVWWSVYAGDTYDHTRYTSNVVNLACRDNDPNSNDQSASDRHMRGLICFKVGEHTINFTNTNIDAYYISVTVEADYTTLNLNKVKFYNSWQGHLFLWSHNNFFDYKDLDTEPGADHVNMKVNITDSLLAKCGGPVILSQNKEANYTRNKYSGADIVVDDKSELYSHVTGQEAWFVAVGQTAMAGQIAAMGNLIPLCNGTPVSTSTYLTDGKIQGVKTINMIYINMGVSIVAGEKYNGTLTIGGKQVVNMTNNPTVDAYVAASGGQAPVFQSSAGGTALTDGKTGCYGIDFSTGTKGLPSAEFYQGDYITMHYIGMGILLEYYH